ncbi:hypothetical protein HDV57DRAFT_492560 [Trichoderma longibrachiatum]
MVNESVYAHILILLVMPYATAPSLISSIHLKLVANGLPCTNLNRQSKAPSSVTLVPPRGASSQLPSSRFGFNTSLMWAPSRD